METITNVPVKVASWKYMLATLVAIGLFLLNIFLSLSIIFAGGGDWFGEIMVMLVPGILYILFLKYILGFRWKTILIFGAFSEILILFFIGMSLFQIILQLLYILFNLDKINLGGSSSI